MLSAGSLKLEGLGSVPKPSPSMAHKTTAKVIYLNGMSNVSSEHCSTGQLRFVKTSTYLTIKTDVLNKSPRMSRAESFKRLRPCCHYYYEHHAMGRSSSRGRPNYSERALIVRPACCANGKVGPCSIGRSRARSRHAPGRNRSDE